MYAHAPAHSKPEYLQVGRAYEELSASARPAGVASAAAVMGLPAGNYGSNGSFAVEGRTSSARARHAAGGFRLTSRAIRHIGMRLLRAATSPRRMCTTHRSSAW